jgi:hypothetical protein
LLFRVSALAGMTLMLLVTPAAISIPGRESGSIADAATGPEEVRVPLRDFLGSSGNLRAVIGTPTALQGRPALQMLLSGAPLDSPGVHALAVSAPDGESLVVVTLAPMRSLRRARLDAYRVGRWPTRGALARSTRYAPPDGFITVTPDNELTRVSKRFRLADFLTHDQQSVWPKVLVLRATLLDKLELIGDRLVKSGLPGSLHVMSGFRTPQYNALGVGSRGGRARESRHMFGDAADVIVDADGDGIMDDLDGDGRITVRDARVLLAVAEGVEAQHPELVGGLSAYPANSAHGPFVHVDTRGVRARW